MLKSLVLALDKFSAYLMKSSESLYKIMAFASYLAIVIGVLGTLFLLLNPAADDEIGRAIVNSFISKYNNLDIEQKMQIKLIFNEIFTVD